MTLDGPELDIIGLDSGLEAAESDVITAELRVNGLESDGDTVVMLDVALCDEGVNGPDMAAVLTVPDVLVLKES